MKSCCAALALLCAALPASALAQDLSPSGAQCSTVKGAMDFFNDSGPVEKLLGKYGGKAGDADQYEMAKPVPGNIPGAMLVAASASGLTRQVTMRLTLASRSAGDAETQVQLDRFSTDLSGCLSGKLKAAEQSGSGYFYARDKSGMVSGVRLHKLGLAGGQEGVVLDIEAMTLRKLPVQGQAAISEEDDM